MSGSFNYSTFPSLTASLINLYSSSVKSVNKSFNNGAGMFVSLQLPFSPFPHVWPLLLRYVSYFVQYGFFIRKLGRCQVFWWVSFLYFRQGWYLACGEIYCLCVVTSWVEQGACYFQYQHLPYYSRNSLRKVGRKYFLLLLMPRLLEGSCPVVQCFIWG